MIERLYPISRELFDREILPIIESITKPQGGRPPEIEHYVYFCAMLKMMSVSLPWRDLPFGIRSVAHDLHALQTLERKRAFVGDFISPQAEKARKNGHHLHGFNDC